MEEVQDEGNSGPARSTTKSRLKKCSFLFCITSASSLTNSFSLCMYVRLVGGGTKRSPSWRLSESCGLKTAVSKLRSSSAKTDPSCRFDQNALPSSGTDSAPDGASTVPAQLPSCAISDKLNLS